MGDSHHTLLRPTFNGSLVIEGREDRLTPLAGTALLRELDERLGVTEALAAKLEDPREACKVQHSMTEILRTLTYTMAADRTMLSNSQRNTGPQTSSLTRIND